MHRPDLIGCLVVLVLVVSCGSASRTVRIPRRVPVAVHLTSEEADQADVLVRHVPDGPAPAKCGYWRETSVSLPPRSTGLREFASHEVNGWCAIADDEIARDRADAEKKEAEAAARAKADAERAEREKTKKKAEAAALELRRQEEAERRAAEERRVRLAKCTGCLDKLKDVGVFADEKKDEITGYFSFVDKQGNYVAASGELTVRVDIQIDGVYANTLDERTYEVPKEKFRDVIIGDGVFARPAIACSITIVSNLFGFARLQEMHRPAFDYIVFFFFKDEYGRMHTARATLPRLWSTTK